MTRATQTSLLAQQIADAVKGRDRVQVMEVCGTHTVSIFRNGIRSLLPPNVRLISGPGCPVCVTAQRHIDAAIELASRAGLTVATYGDMIRVPGRVDSLETLRARGADIRVVNSARTALQLAQRNVSRQVVFLGVGFETTAPATAATILEAEQLGINNFSVLASHKLVVPAMMALLDDGDVPLDGFLCPGHVSVIIGVRAYEPIAARYGKACVIAGFEAQAILVGLLRLMQLVGQGRASVENAYAGIVREDGNPAARRLMERVFVTCDAPWRALGVIPASGLELAPAYERFDAAKRFDIVIGEDCDPPGCRCGEVIQGKVEPLECGLFGSDCTPVHPVGPCMVSSEGTCAAWFKYHWPSMRQEGRT
jgi:hydrogenase expression/formation protein HypD